MRLKPNLIICYALFYCGFWSLLFYKTVLKRWYFWFHLQRSDWPWEDRSERKGKKKKKSSHCSCDVIALSKTSASRRHSSSTTSSATNIPAVSDSCSRHSVYQVDIVWHSLSPSYLRDDASKWRHDARMLSMWGTGGWGGGASPTEGMRMMSHSVEFFFFLSVFLTHFFPDCGKKKRWLCEVTRLKAYWVAALCVSLAVIAARNSHIRSHCASNVSLFMHNWA